MSSVAIEQQTEKCNAVPGLVSQQLNLCQNNPDSLLCVSEGLLKYYSIKNFEEDMKRNLIYQ
jgi:hypothetical protein